MPYGYDKFNNLRGTSTVSPAAMAKHDQNTGIFIRLFSTGELHMRMTICILIRIDLLKGMFLLSKMSAGQTADLFRETIKAHSSEEIAQFGSKTAGKYLSLNQFRNELAHSPHFFDGEIASLAKQSADFQNVLGKETKLSAPEFEKKIDEMLEFMHEVVALYAKIGGSTKDIKDLVAISREGGKVFEGIGPLTMPL